MAAHMGLFATTRPPRGLFGVESLDLRLHQTPKGLPRHTFRRREFELYQRFRNEGAGLSEPGFRESGVLLSHFERELWREFERRAAFDAVQSL